MVLVTSCFSLLSPSLFPPEEVSFFSISPSSSLARSFDVRRWDGCQVRLVPDPDEVLAELFRHGGALLGHDRVFVQADNQCWKKTKIETLQIR